MLIHIHKNTQYYYTSSTTVLMAISSKRETDMKC